MVEVDLIKCKNQDELVKNIHSKAYEVIAYSNFLQEASVLVKRLTGNKLEIIPLLYKENMIYIVKFNNKKLTFKNKKDTESILRELGIYEEFDKAIDLFLLNFENVEIDKLFTKLANKEDLTDEEIKLIINSIQKRIEDEDDIGYFKVRAKCHQLIDKLYNHKTLGTVHHCLIGRRKYAQIVNTFSKEVYSKALSIRRIKEEIADPYILYNPQTMQYVYESEFKDVPQKYKDYFNNIEDRLMRFWRTAQDRITEAFDKAEAKFEVCLVGYNLLTGQYIINIFNGSSFTGEHFMYKSDLENEVKRIIKEQK